VYHYNIVVSTFISTTNTGNTTMDNTTNTSNTTTNNNNNTSDDNSNPSSHVARCGLKLDRLLEIVLLHPQDNLRSH
jgi:hypothetical protein